MWFLKFAITVIFVTYEFAHAKPSEWETLLEKKTIAVSDYTVPGRTVPKRSVDHTTCVTCEFAMGQIEKILKDNATKEEITAVVTNICSYLPTAVRDQCNNFRDTYGPEISQLLIEELDPTKVCVQIGVCNTNKD